MFALAGNREVNDSTRQLAQINALTISRRGMVIISPSVERKLSDPQRDVLNGAEGVVSHSSHDSNATRVTEAVCFSVR